MEQVDKQIQHPRLLISVPCYNEELVLRDTTTKLSELLSNLIQLGEISEESYILYSDDGSKDGTWQLIEELHQKNSFVLGLKLSTNYGFQNNLLAGISTARNMADIVVTIDADLQDDYTVIPQMIQQYKEGCELVCGVRNDRSSDSVFKRVTAQGFYHVMQSFGVKTIFNHADFRLMSSTFIDALLEYKERNMYIRGIVPIIGYKTGYVYYCRKAREAGESKFNIKSMINLAVEGITSFSIKPMRMLLFVGFFFILIALGTLIYVLASKEFAVRGWSSMMLSIWFVGGCIMVALGVIGEYIGKIYMESKARPRYNIEKVLIDDGL